MLRPWLVVALFLMVSGCSSGPEVEDATPTPTTSTASTTAPATVPLTDTLHLLDPPHMAATLPAGGTLFRTHVPSDINSVTVGFDPPRWSLPRPDLASLKVSLDLWVDVQGSVGNPPRPVFSGAAPFVYLNSCFWSVDLFVEQADGTIEGLTSYCFPEPEVVPTGARVLQVFASTTPEVAFMPGDRIGFSISTYGAYGPDGRVEILSGVPEHDSTVTIESVRWPVDTLTLTH